MYAKVLYKIDPGFETYFIWKKSKGNQNKGLNPFTLALLLQRIEQFSFIDKNNTFFSIKSSI